MNRLEYLFGENYVEAWKNMLWRMETGIKQKARDG